MVALDMQTLFIRELGHTQGLNVRSGLAGNALGDLTSESAHGERDSLCVPLPCRDVEVADAVALLVVAHIVRNTFLTTETGTINPTLVNWIV